MRRSPAAATQELLRNRLCRRSERGALPRDDGQARPGLALTLRTRLLRRFMVVGDTVRAAGSRTSCPGGDFLYRQAFPSRCPVVGDNCTRQTAPIQD